jgi:predicted RNA binding protein YcfA (HicA-like mRNA interferase family)
MAREDRYSVRNCKSARDFERAVSHQGGEITRGGRHDLVHDADGKGSVAIPRHGGDDLAPGTQHSIVKSLLLLGFFVLIPACLCIAAAAVKQNPAVALAAYTVATATPMPVYYPSEATGCLSTLAIIGLPVLYVLSLL